MFERGLLLPKFLRYHSKVRAINGIVLEQITQQCDLRR